MTRISLIGLVLGAFLNGGAAVAGCGGVGPDPCQLPGGEYHIVSPQAGGSGASIMFVHGYGGSGEGVLRNTGVVNAALARGYAVIAPSGMKMQGRTGRSWSFHPERVQRRDEVAFLVNVRDDAARRHGLDPGRMLLAGFSIGGSMTSYLACTAPDSFAAYAPVGGGFWRPHPDACAGPVRLLHTHGWRDGTVPLEGRILRGEALDEAGVVAQGDIFRTLEIWRAANGCKGLRADGFGQTGQFLRRRWDKCDADTALEFALFPGGHVIPKGWADMTIDWFEGL